MVHPLLKDSARRVVDTVADFLEEPQDLLALALTCRKIRDIIIPDHLHLRRFRCNLFYVRPWIALTLRPDLAARIYTLAVTTEHKEDWRYPFPKSLKRTALSIPDGTFFVRDAFNGLKSALRAMRNLEGFVWSFGAITSTSSIFRALMDLHPMLSQLQLGDALHPFRYAYDDILCTPLQGLSFLSSISLRIYPRDDLSVLKKCLITSCPMLEDLHLSFDSSTGVSLTELLIHGHWPHLKRLTLDYGTSFYDGVSHHEVTALTSYFFQRHPLLSSLFIRNEILPLGSITNDTTPSLRSLSIPGSRTARLSTLIPPDIASNLVDIRCKISETCLSLLSQMVSLRICVVRGMNHRKFAHFINALPESIERVHIATWTKNPLQRQELIKQMDQCAVSLARLHSLTHFGGLQACLDTTSTQFRHCITWLLGPPQMRCAIISDKGVEMWAQIDRNKEGIYQGHREKRYERVNAWGDFFFHIRY